MYSNFIHHQLGKLLNINGNNFNLLTIVLLFIIAFTQFINFSQYYFNVFENGFVII